MIAQPKNSMTEQAYLALERSGSYKHEYFDGEIFAMSGGTASHNLISGNAFASLHTQLRGTGCRVFNSDMRLKVVATGLNTYPDVTIVCGNFQFADESRDTIINPMVIIEVLSPSTERYDRGMKFQNYRMIATLQEYILIAQDKHQIEHYVRQESGQWIFEEAKEFTDTITLPSVRCVLPMSDVYDGVDVEQEPTRMPRDIPHE
ncbi:MAG: Uma2 family endonuclease [Chloroflexales bacterium]|jgi:Uma2 family endonuclease